MKAGKKNSSPKSKAIAIALIKAKVGKKNYSKEAINEAIERSR